MLPVKFCSSLGRLLVATPHVAHIQLTYKYNEIPMRPRQWPEGAAIGCVYVCVRVWVWTRAHNPYGPGRIYARYDTTLLARVSIIHRAALSAVQRDFLWDVPFDRDVPKGIYPLIFFSTLQQINKSVLSKEEALPCASLRRCHHSEKCSSLFFLNSSRYLSRYFFLFIFI